MSIQQLFFTGEAAPAVVATGGTIYTNGDYKIHAFTTSGNFRVTEINNASSPYEFYVVGGGNAGTGDNGGSSSGSSGANGGGGGEGGAYTAANGTINAFTVNTDYFAEVASGGSTSSFKGSSAGASGGGSGGSGGNSGFPPTAGTSGSVPASITWISGVTTRLGSGGGGGGGGCDDAGGVYNAGGGNPNGGGGGSPCSDGNSGDSVNNLYWPGAGPGGGGGAGGCDGGSQSGGSVGPAGTGLVIIRYKYKNV